MHLLLRSFSFFRELLIDFEGMCCVLVSLCSSFYHVIEYVPCVLPVFVFQEVPLIHILCLLFALVGHPLLAFHVFLLPAIHVFPLLRPLSCLSFLMLRSTCQPILPLMH
jgi:hypothetical protein